MYMWLGYIVPPGGRCDSIDKLKKRCETLDKEIQDNTQFKEFYQFTFNFAKNPGQKGLGKY